MDIRLKRWALKKWSVVKAGKTKVTLESFCKNQKICSSEGTILPERGLKAVNCCFRTELLKSHYQTSSVTGTLTCRLLKARLEHFYTLPKQTVKEWVSGSAITLTLMEPDMPGYAEKTGTAMLKLTYVRKQILAESGVVFHVSAISLDVMLS